MNIERAAVTATPSDVAIKLRNAPAWVRQGRGCSTGKAAGSSGKPAPKPAQKPVSIATKPALRSAPVIGWIAGVCCPGVSKPAYGHRDGETLPEQFTPACFERMVERIQRQDGKATLTWGHHGDVLAVTPFDLTVSIDRTVGLQFEVRLRDGSRARQLLDEIGTRAGLAVSIGYAPKSQWLVERDGVGRIRVVDDAVLDHIAILPKAHGYGPAYAGARAFGARSTGRGCPSELRRDAKLWAFEIVRNQAGATR